MLHVLHLPHQVHYLKLHIIDEIEQQIKSILPKKKDISNMASKHIGVGYNKAVQDMNRSLFGDNDE